jgi:hypothetical protein
VGTSLKDSAQAPGFILRVIWVSRNHNFSILIKREGSKLKRKVKSKQNE